MEKHLNLDILPKLEPFLTDAARWKVAYGGRGGGKSWSVARMLILRSMIEPVRVLCARETQKSINESVHHLIKSQVSAMGLDGSFYVTENKIVCTDTGAEFVFAGIRQQSVVNMKSFEAVDICWVEEAQVVTKKSWDVLSPTIRKPGSEIWVTFNPELDTDETFVRLVLNTPTNAIRIKVNYGDNPWFTDEMNMDRLDCLARDPIGYKTIWEGECRPAVEGAIYAAEMAMLQEQGRLCNAPYDPLLKVHTVWDLGWNDMMAIALVQRSSSGEVRIIDYIEDSHRTLDSYIIEIKSRSYNWGTDFIPHDGRAKDFRSGKSTEEILLAMGRNPFVLGVGDVEQGIKSARMMISRCWFDHRATGLVNRLKRYRRAQNQTTGEYGSPLHDENSHGADCFRYIAMAEQQMSNDDWGSVTLSYPKLFAA
jgi:phage terminase large subunit